MHSEVIQYIQSVKDRYPEYFSGVSVIDYGSKNINGSCRSLFDNADYTGVNRDKGRDVDVVSRMHEYIHPKLVDVVVTSSAMEHDKYVWQSLDRCWELLRRGGLLVGTTTGPGFPVHNDDEGEDNHYANIIPDDLRAWMRASTDEWEVLSEVGHQNGTEIWFYAIKP